MTRCWSAIIAILSVPAALSAQVPPEATPAPAVPGTPSSGPSSRDLFDAIHVVVGPSGRSLDPIAIARLTCPSGQAACAEIDKTLDKDLTLSGYFKVLDRASFLADPAKESLVAVSWADWANVGAKYLVKTEVKAGARGLDIEFRLMNVLDRKNIPVKGQSHSGVAPGEVRGAVHAFVNGVIEAVTGKPGIFGTTLVMSLKTGPWERAIVALDVGGTGRRTLVSNGSSNMFPHWAPGGEVLYTSFLPGIPSLYIGGRRITNDGREYRGAAFAPGGGKIAASVDMGGQSDIVLVDPKSGAILKNLTNSSWDEVSPSWSPDGSRIAYVSNRTGSPQIEVMSAGGGDGRRLTMAGSYNTSPDFGPNGLIVFSGMDGFRNDIFTVDLSGNLARLTQDQGSNKDPTWSPDGRYVAFLSNREGGWKLWVMTDDGRYQFPLSDAAGAYATPDWGR